MASRAVRNGRSGGAPHPFQDGVGTVEDMEIGGFPHVRLDAGGEQGGQVAGRLQHRSRAGPGARAGHPSGPIGPARRAGCGSVRRSWPAPGRRIRRLGQGFWTNIGNSDSWPGTHCRVAVESSTSTGPSGCQSRRSACTELQSAGDGLGPGVSDHLGRVVDPDHMGVRPALEQLAVVVPGSAAEVDDLPGLGMRDTGQQLGEGALPFVLVAEILLGVPARRHRPDARTWRATRCRWRSGGGGEGAGTVVRTGLAPARRPKAGWKKRRCRADIDATTSGEAPPAKDPTRCSPASTCRAAACLVPSPCHGIVQCIRASVKTSRRTQGLRNLDHQRLCAGRQRDRGPVAAGNAAEATLAGHAVRQRPRQAEEAVTHGAHAVDVVLRGVKRLGWSVQSESRGSRAHGDPVGVVEAHVGADELLEHGHRQRDGRAGRAKAGSQENNRPSCPKRCRSMVSSGGGRCWASMTGSQTFDRLRVEGVLEHQITPQVEEITVEGGQAPGDRGRPPLVPPAPTGPSHDRILRRRPPGPAEAWAGERVPGPGRPTLPGSRRRRRDWTLDNGLPEHHYLSMSIVKPIDESPISFRLDPSSGVPPYLQLVHQVEDALRLGYLAPGDRLPRVKDAVAVLAINPNTVLKAYRELEQKGLVAGKPGQGTFVQAGLDVIPLADRAALRRKLIRWINDAAEAGLDDNAMRALFTRALHESREGGSSEAVS